MFKWASQEVCEEHQFPSEFMAQHVVKPSHSITTAWPVNQHRPLLHQNVQMTHNNLPDWSWEGVAALEDCMHINSLWPTLNITHYLRRLFKNNRHSIILSCSWLKLSLQFIAEYDLWHYANSYSIFRAATYCMFKAMCYSGKGNKESAAAPDGGKRLGRALLKA